jgi:hypothetical protein
LRCRRWRCAGPGARDPDWERACIERADNIFTFWNELVPAYATMHEMGARIPCECIWLTAHSFRSEEFLGRNRVPSYGAWLAGADPIEWAKDHREFARAFESFPQDADALYPGWRDHLGVAAA